MSTNIAILSVKTKTMRVEIHNEQNVKIFDSSSISVDQPSGCITILDNHEDMICALERGKIIFSDQQILNVECGMLIITSGTCKIFN